MEWLTGSVKIIKVKPMYHRKKKKEIKIKDTYRIDYQTQEIDDINENRDAYEYLYSVLQIGDTSENRESTIIRKIEEWK